MTHEPECGYRIGKEKANAIGIEVTPLDPEKGHCPCLAIRKAYQRGREDVAQRVRELHKPVENEIGTYCHECIDNPDSWRYPCPTIKALDGEK